MLHRPVFINAISLPHLIIEIEMKIYNKKTALALGLCGVFATLPAVAALTPAVNPVDLNLGDFSYAA